jgi:D-arabinose 1-dehydrogenase-like Zn-dependent alcohol dehydrogenase
VRARSASRTRASSSTIPRSRARSHISSRALGIRGSYVGTLDELREVIALGREGKVPPIPTDIRPLDAAPKAMADLRAGRVRGRVILKPEG